MSNAVEQRENWGSRFGFVMAAAGSAVGLGNIWKFPYLAGANGGAAFVAIYLAIVLSIGISVMLAEFTIGRASGLNAVGAFKKLAGGAWPLVGWLGVLAGFLILSFYGVVAGWTMKYMVISFTGLMEAAKAGQAGALFGAFLNNPLEQVIYQVIFMVATIVIVHQGIGGGIEKACKVMMPALFAILVVLIVRSNMLPGAEKGLEFYLMPDFSKVTGGTVLAALGQVFFSLSLGMGCMITYGSYLSKNESLPFCTLVVPLIDTAVAFLAGLAIFPAVFAFGMEPGAGPGLTFVTLPAVFAQMPMGEIFSCLFFLLLFFAAITSSISLLEVCVAYFKDEMGWSRPFAAWVLGGVTTLLGVPCALSLADNTPWKIAGKSFFDSMDFISSNVCLPLGGIFIALFVGWFWLEPARKEATNNGKHPFAWEPLWIWCCRVVAPVAIAYIFISGLKW